MASAATTGNDSAGPTIAGPVVEVVDPASAQRAEVEIARRRPGCGLRRAECQRAAHDAARQLLEDGVARHEVGLRVELDDGQLAVGGRHRHRALIRAAARFLRRARHARLAQPRDRALDVVGAGLAQDIVAAWLDAEFEGGRHARRVEQIGRRMSELEAVCVQVEIETPRG